MPMQTKAPTPTLFVAAVSIGLMIFVATSCVSGDGTSAKPKNLGSSEALTMCQYALKKVSRDPEKASVPYVPDQGSGSEFYFAWGQSTKMTRMQNGLGIEVAATASCIVSKSEKRITTSLTLDGKTIL